MYVLIQIKFNFLLVSFSLQDLIGFLSKSRYPLKEFHPWLPWSLCCIDCPKYWVEGFLSCEPGNLWISFLKITSETRQKLVWLMNQFQIELVVHKILSTLFHLITCKCMTWIDFLLIFYFLDQTWCSIAVNHNTFQLEHLQNKQHSLR